MLGSNARPAVARFWAPVVRWLAGVGVTPDMVTLTGTLGAVAGAVLLIATGQLFWGAFTQTAMRVVRSVSGAHGFNIGMNQGSVAGAGIADHLHQHAVPRWGGDTNFMPVIGLTRVLPQVLSETRDLLAAAWPADVPGREA